MASSRLPSGSPSASPQRDASAATMDLTPRSKVKAMLSALDGDSDSDESVVLSARRTASRGANLLDTAGKASLADSTRPKTSAFLQDNTDSESSDAVGGAYARVKFRLLKTKAETVEGVDANAPATPRSAASSPAPSRGSSPHNSSPRPAARQSPGLFVSPERPRSAQSASRHGSSPAQPMTVQQRLHALAARRREELAAQNPVEAFSADSESDTPMVLPQPKPTKKGSKTKTPKTRVVIQSEDDEDPEARKKLTQSAQPTRKASKKAIEEMNRETQRMNRNMQLAHEARTVKKFTTDSLFARFHFRVGEASAAPAVAEAVVVEPAVNIAPSSSPQRSSSDAERQVQSTPPSSPPSASKVIPKAQVQEEMDDLSVLDTSSEEEAQVVQPTEKKFSIRKFAKSAVKHEARFSDDDLEVVRPAPDRLAIFQNVNPVAKKVSDPHFRQRALAQIEMGDDSRHKGRNSMKPSELFSLLHRRAKEQAIQERDEKIQRAREKGIFIQTAEEKERDQMQVEDLLEKARVEAEEIAKREKEAAKREGRDIDDGLESSDESYRASDEEDGPGDLEELSGSEDEPVENEHESAAESDAECNGDDSKVDGIAALIENEASEDEDEEEDDADLEDGFDLDEPQANETLPRSRRRQVVESDDEDTDAVPATPGAPSVPPGTFSNETPAAKAFGFAAPAGAGLGLSQVFAGTMADVSSQSDEGSQDQTQDHMAKLRGVPDQELIDFENFVNFQSPAAVVHDSQTFQTPSMPAEAVYFEPLSATQARTQLSDIEPTQDVGFHIMDEAEAMPHATQATVETVLLDEQSGDDDMPRPRRRLQRKLQRTESVLVAQSDESDSDGAQGTSDVFRFMEKARAQAAQIDNFNKKRSDARGMVEEQAEESEDEYAGLGGASDDDSDSDMDEATKRMIDDESNEKTNARAVAALHAENARLDDERGIERLYKDVINGGLRRKRGAANDLWDSDDEDEAAERRRSAKQREFARMRRALLNDEKIGKIADNPKQAAFFQTLEDRDDLDELDFLDGREESYTTVVLDSQTEQTEARPLSELQANAAGVKRDADTMGPPPNPRRSKVAAITKPTSFADIRNTLSEILGEPESILESQLEALDTESESDGGSTDDNVESAELTLETSPQNPRRTLAGPSRAAVIDRMSLKRQSSAASAAVQPGGFVQTRLAYFNASASASTFKVPSLLRRVTSNASTDSSSSNNNSQTGLGGLGGKDVIRRGGTKKSSVNYYRREAERHTVVAQVERERDSERQRIGELRRARMAGQGSQPGQSGLRASTMSGLVGGQFESQ